MNQLKVAIVGMGFMGRLYSRILSQMPNARLIACCDLDAAPLKAFLAESNIPAAVFPDGDLRRMLNSHPEIDAVFVCTPEDKHAEAACEAARAGKHLFVEKPLATTVADARKIAETVRQTGVACMTGFCLRFDPRYAGAKDAVAKGEIGDVVHMYARRNSPVFLLRRLGGRVSHTHWVGAHDLDMMLWIKGSGVRSVFSRQAGVGVAGFKVDQAISSTLKFADGSIAVLENVWGTALTQGRHDRIEFQINGVLGTIEIHPAETGLGLFREGSAVYPDTVYSPVVQGKICGVYREEIEYFVETVRGGGHPFVSAEDGLKAVLVADAIERSRCQEREIVLE